jgi:glyoxylase-like metal-dependent hydrolase (beta-lactamase superfamily II)
MNRIIVTALAATLLGFAGAASAQQVDFSKVEVKTTDLGHNTYMLEGAGGNVTIAVGGDGVIMVDSQFAPMHDKLKAAIAAVTSQPVRYVVNTHFHGDHTGGDEAFAKDGAVVVANVNVKKRLADGSVNGLTGAKTPGVSGQALPSKVYTDGTTLRVKGRLAKLGHPKNAHTDGDTYVYFADANVLSTGDIVTLGRYPNIDFANGGNIKGMIAGADTYLKLANAQTKIVPGHGPLASKADLVAYRAMLVTARDRMAKLVKAGRTEQEVIAAKPFADLDAKVSANEQQSTNFVRVVYHSLKP